MVYEHVIPELGGPSRVAELCDITPQAVGQWRQKGIPKPWQKYLALRFPHLAKDAPAPSEPATEERG